MKKSDPMTILMEAIKNLREETDLEAPPVIMEHVPTKPILKGSANLLDISKIKNPFKSVHFNSNYDEENIEITLIEEREIEDVEEAVVVDPVPVTSPEILIDINQINNDIKYMMDLISR